MVTYGALSSQHFLPAMELLSAWAETADAASGSMAGVPLRLNFFR